MKLNSTATGQQAEAVATQYLHQKGYNILEKNWRTRWCEIDIVAEQSATLYFVEVKYRRTNFQGAGVDYITPQKLRQMERAALWYVSEQRWPGDYRLAVIEVAGLSFAVTRFISELH